MVEPLALTSVSVKPAVKASLPRFRHGMARLMRGHSEVLLAVEREPDRRACTAEGRSRAKAQGKHMGRPPSLTPAQQKEAIRRRAQGATLDELARSYNVSRATISRLAA